MNKRSEEKSKPSGHGTAKIGKNTRRVLKILAVIKKWCETYASVVELSPHKYS